MCQPPGSPATAATSFGPPRYPARAHSAKCSGSISSAVEPCQLLDESSRATASKKDLFLKAWTELYPGTVEIRPGTEVVEFVNKRQVIRTIFDKPKIDLFIPPLQVGQVAQFPGSACSASRARRRCF